MSGGNVKEDDGYPGPMPPKSVKEMECLPRGEIDKLKAALHSAEERIRRMDEDEKHDRQFAQDSLDLEKALNETKAKLSLAKDALETVEKKQPEVLEMLRKHKFVFRGKGGRWEKLAFTLYTDICFLYTIAKEALASLKEDKKP